MVRRVALVVAYGPEGRSLLQSGLAERLARDFEPIVVTAEPGSQAFEGRREPVHPLPCESESPAMLKLRAWARGVRRRAQLLSGAALGAERAAGRLLGGGHWTRFFTTHSVDAVVAASATGGRTLPALQAASNLGLPAAVLLNSWKDLSKTPALPAPVTALGLVEPLDPGQAVTDPLHTSVCGSLHHAAVRSAPAMSRQSFCEAAGLDPDRPILCYASAMGDPGEAERILGLADRFRHAAERPQLLVRTNPMQAGAPAMPAIPGVAVLRPRWEWSRERDWCCPLPEDLPWWRAVLDHSAAAITLPSTITLDFAAWGKPSVNIVWGPGETRWHDLGYAAIRRLPGTLAAASPDHAVVRVEDLLREPALGPAPCDDPVEAATRLIQTAFMGEAVAPRAAAAQAVAP